MNRFQNPQKIFFLYSSFLTICALFALINIVAYQSEPGNAVLFGLSLPRLFLAVFFLCASVLFISLASKSAKDQVWTEEMLESWFGNGRFRSVAVWLSGISTGVGWIGFFIPTYFIPKFESYWIRIQSLFLFILIFGIASVAVFYIKNRKNSFLDIANIKILKTGAALFLGSLSVLAVMLISKFGVYSRDDFWYGAGVPVLVLQSAVAIAGGLLFPWIERKWKVRRFDLWMFILIFASASFLWAREPLQKSFLFIGPHFPNQVLYPFADAAKFDTASQFAVIGQKIFFVDTFFFERPLYIGFLAYLHNIIGQDYATLMAVQAGIFAIFPALVYLIGRALDLRSVGFAAALIATFRGINSIAASNMIDMANPKMILTDFPAAIGMALVVLAICEWLRAPAQNQKHALWLGGALGFTLMLRTNALMLLVLIPPYVFFRFFPDWKKWLFGSLLIILAAISVTLPWEIRNQSLGGQMYGPIINKFKAVIEQRYTRDETAGLTSQLPVIQNTQALTALVSMENFTQSEAVCASIACFVPNHFLHNIITSILILPTSPLMDDLRHTVKETNPYWNRSWDGNFMPFDLPFFFMNVFLVTLGISVAWHRGRFRGVAPLAIFMFYNLSNAFARTSGGRYLVPMDWIITIYFALGVFQAIIWLAATIRSDWNFEFTALEQETDKSISHPGKWRAIGLVLVVLFGLGSLVPLSENISAPRYKDFDVGKALEKNEAGLEAAGLNMDSINTFLQDTGAEVFVGRALYPRYYKMGQGEPHFFPTIAMPFPRMTFTLIGNKGENGVVLPGSVTQHFPHASDVLVIGCDGKDYFDALAVIILDETGSVYVRNPQPELQCPLQQPVCNNNSACR